MSLFYCTGIGSVAEKVMSRCSAAAGAIQLTFDDGPHRRVTARILEVLRQERARATFFVVGNRLKQPGALDIVAEAIVDGHTIGNHSLTHHPTGLQTPQRWLLALPC